MGRDTNKQEKPRKKDEDILSVTSSHSRRCFLKDTVNMREKKRQKIYPHITPDAWVYVGTHASS